MIKVLQRYYQGQGINSGNRTHSNGPIALLGDRPCHVTVQDQFFL